MATFYQVKFRQFATFSERIEGMYEVSEVNEGARYRHDEDERAWPWYIYGQPL
jgi:hypothetical protein